MDVKEDNIFEVSPNTCLIFISHLRQEKKIKYGSVYFLLIAEIA